MRKYESAMIVELGTAADLVRGSDEGTWDGKIEVPNLQVLTFADCDE